MNGKHAGEASPKSSAWFSESSHSSLIAQQAQRLESFLSTMADGQVDEAEIQAQEQRLVALMKEVEPQLDEKLHAQVTQLLCELTSYDLMRMIHEMQKARPATKFRG
jgi:hypothetical protein